MMPDKFADGTWLRGSFNDNGTDELGYWNATNPGIWQGDWDEARHLFSKATCSGCHGRETNTGFLHIHNNDSGAALLSPFLSGPLSVTDPVNGSIVRHFDEMARREEDLNWLVAGKYVGVPVVRNSYTGGKNAAMNYKLVFMHSAKCMDVAGNSQNDGALVQQYTCHGRGNQRVALVDHGQSVYSFVFKHSGKCLEVENASTTNGARLVQRTCTSAQNQKLAMWFSASQTGRYFKFLHSEMCIQVQNANTGNSAPVVQATCPEGDDPLSAKFVE
jgi:hypothetical protein